MSERIQLTETNIKAIDLFNKFINSTFNIYVKDNSYSSYLIYIKEALRKCKTCKIVPYDLVKEREDLVRRLDRSCTSYVRGDSFGDGMPRGDSDPLAEEKKHIERIQMNARLNELIETCNKYLDANDRIKDLCKNVIDLLENETHRSVLNCLFVYKQSISEIARHYGYAYETIRAYQNRGFERLAEILLSREQNRNK